MESLITENFGTECPMPLRKRIKFIFPLLFMLIMYFSIGFVPVLNAVLVPFFKDAFNLSNFQALLVPFCFFAPSCLMGFPSGKIIQKIGYRPGILAALITVAFGLLLFLPASLAGLYPLFLIALFVTGSGQALLMVAINPYIGALGSPKTAAARRVLGNGFSGVGSMTAPSFGSILIFGVAGVSVASMTGSVATVYLALSGCALLAAIIGYFLYLPDVMDDEKNDTTNSNEGSIWQFRHLLLGMPALFLYGGAETSIGNLMIIYLAQPSMGGMLHGDAANYVSLYWAASTIGSFIGTFILRKVPAHWALLAASSLAFGACGLAIYGHGSLTIWALVSVGLFNSLMFPCIFTLATKDLGPFTAEGSGLLITMVAGSAIVPLAEGFIADVLGYKITFVTDLLCYAYVIYFSITACSKTSITLATPDTSAEGRPGRLKS